MKNLGGDKPFNGDIGVNQVFDFTDRIMAFDVNACQDEECDDVSPIKANTSFASFGPRVGDPTMSNSPRRVGLFEGSDEFGRLQPLLGTIDSATDFEGNTIYWPDEDIYRDHGLIGPMNGTMSWHNPTTENPAIDTVEEWEIWNLSGDAHPIHLHLVHFEVLGRYDITWDDETNEDDRVLGDDPVSSTGTYLKSQSVVGHHDSIGNGFRVMNPTRTEDSHLDPEDGYIENMPKDVVTALPNQVTVIKAKFDEPGRYVWHCHILSHEDHEMMRILHVGSGYENAE
eukprot:CAMPEP_0113573598 /NCGR_PEP_ID=MMETSP0015_2-20120614/26706_1 /TAXON_ID=2838 /ORGANISM="Odontella" /LENGTH=283 /DNA_ID=CAMNT_0000476693 /DNA_START=333 /DNA_END=1184 /DNA_ORIENTATION=- /assembly_acc=CAM_ASM_000160